MVTASYDGRAPQPQPRRREAAYEETAAMSAVPDPAAAPSSGPTPAPGRRAARANRNTQQTQVMQQGPGQRTPGRRRSGGAPYGGTPGGPGRGDSGGPGGPGGSGGGKDLDDEPKRRGWRRFVPNWKIVLVAFAVLTAGVFGMITVAYLNTPLPVVTQQSATQEGSVIYYRDGKTEIARLGVKREIVPITRIPKHVQDAIISAENRSFRTDAGIDLMSIARSAWMTVTGQQLQGGSTITQQMVRNYYDGLSQEVSFSRKIKEIFVAVRVDREMSKDQIFAHYANTIYFGRGAHGIQAAAQAFFRKNVDQLTIAEGAYLAGRIQNPDRFDRAELANDWAPTKERFNYVINGMATVVDPAKYGNLIKTAKFPKVKKRDDTEINRGIKGYMIDAVKRELKERASITEDDLNGGGYRIITTFDKRLMLAAKRTVESNLKAVGDKNVRANLAAVDPNNGRVIAFYSGHDYLDKRRGFTNNAFVAYKQAASAFKPYVLAAWLESGYSLKSFVSGKGPVELPGTKPISNSHDVGAAVRIDKATAESVNTAFATMAQEVGLDQVIKIAEQAGISKKNLEQARKDHAFALSIGSGLVTPVEQASGYTMFVNGGKHYAPHVVISVKGDGGKSVYEENAPASVVISPDTAADVTYALEQVVKSGTARGTVVPGHEIAGKTGTNNENKEAWFVGYTAQLSAAVGMYKEVAQTDPKTGKVLRDPNGFPLPKEVPLPGIQGADTPTKIWKEFMIEAMKNRTPKPLPKPAFAGTQHDLVQRPEPKQEEDPSGEGGNECLPGDFACVGNGGGNGDFGDDGFGGGDDGFGGGNGDFGGGDGPFQEQPNDGVLTDDAVFNNGNPASHKSRPAGEG
ncbi:transglycosylase domain-containing protein [Thermopolyspora sp. NPDC052614]|uniref:transglycosylase domain-containing protein n=1 Tax=Thermopolyspora sp. NPDC052614 TaxID=3155682 RepID=UPI0034322DFF